MKYFKRIVRYLGPHSGLAIASVMFTVLTALAALLAPWPLKILVDNVLGNEPLPSILAWALGPLTMDRWLLMIIAVVAGPLVTLLQHGLTVFQEYVNTRLGRAIVLDFRSDLFKHVQRLSFAFHDRRRTGNLIFAVNYQADQAASLLMAIPPIAQSALTLVGMFWVLMNIDAQLALLSLAVVPFLYYAVGYYATHIVKRIRDVKSLEGQSLSLVHETISMLRVIVAFGRETYEYLRFRQQAEHALDARVRLTVRQTLFSLAVSMVTAGGTALVLGVGASRALEGRVTVGDLLVVVSYLASVYKPLEQISYAIGSLQERFVSLQIAFDLLDTEPEIKDDPNAIELERASGHIRFEGVHFSYSGRRNTLTDISFEAQPGQVVGVVGPTGAGKTTLVSLIPRFYDAKKGRILIDGADARQYTLSSLRRQISFVMQEPLLFRDTIASNIQYGRFEASLDEVVEAAKAANAHDFIMKLPKQYETAIGERGVQLSVGERQRVCIARAFLKDAPILILDEPTASIDSKTEAAILEALQRLMVGRTTFMIAHRLSTIVNADLILVVNDGKIVEQGTHDDLLQRDGLYKQLYELQNRRPRRTKEPALATAPVGQPGSQA